MWKNIRQEGLSSAIQDWAIANGSIIFAVVGAVILTLALKALLSIGIYYARDIVKKTSSKIDDVIVDCLEAIRTWVLLLWILVPALHFSHGHPFILKLGQGLLIIVSAIQIAIWGFYLISIWKKNYLETSKGPNVQSAIGLVSSILQGILITALVLIALSNLGVDIGALVAGLGIGGIAVALAAQNILGDMFASISIVLDKPFEVGDFINAGPQMGTVENIGIKTTRVRSLSGEELIFSNKDLLQTRLQNFKRMWNRRVEIHFLVPLNTDHEQLQQIPLWIKEFVDQNTQLQMDRCHLADFSASALVFELVYWVKSADYNLHMNFKQDLLLKIIKRLKADNIGIAIPAQTLFLENFAIAEEEKKYLNPQL